MIDWKSKILRSKWGGSAGALIAILLGLSLRFVYFGADVPLGQGWITWSYDLLFAFRPNQKASDAVIVYMDEESHRTLNQPYDRPWDRQLHAQLLERLTTEKARLVVMDIFFSEPGETNANRAFAAAIKSHGNVVLGLELNDSEVPDVAAGSTIYYPVEELEKAAAGVGLVTMLADSDYGQRQYFSGDYHGADFIPSLTWKAAELYGAKITRLPKMHDQERWLNYYGPPGAFPNVSYYLALRTNGVPQGFFRDKVVFVGKAAGMTGFTRELKDEFRSPYTWWTRKFISGVEVHATAFLNLVRQDWLVRMPPLSEAGMLLLFGVLLGYGLTLVKPIHSLIVGTAVGIGFTLISFLLFWKFRLWWSWLLVATVQLPAAVFWSVCYNSIKLHVEKKVLESSLCLHISPARVKQIMARPELLRPGAEKQEISILFTDIANFTSTTERMEPDDLFKLLNQYFQMSLGCIHEEDGTIIQLIGDAIYAIWNAPFMQPDQQKRACRAALKLRNQLVQFDIQQRSLPLRTRVGLHTGFAYVGNIGSTSRFDYTAIGDSINLASRLEGLNKYLGTDILASRDIQKIIEPDVVSRLVGHFILKGLTRVTEVHELIDFKDRCPGGQDWRATFADGLYHFQRKSFKAAQTSLIKTLKLRPGDGPSQFYLRKIRDYLHSPPPESWEGEIAFTDK